MHGAYFRIIRNVRLSRSDYKGRGLNQYVIRALSTRHSRLTHNIRDMKINGNPYPKVHTMNTVWSIWAYLRSISKKLLLRFCFRYHFLFITSRKTFK